MGITRIAGWQLVEQHAEAEYMMRRSGMVLVGTSLENAAWQTVDGPTQFYRMTRRLVYECPVTDGSTLPDAPLNPGGLDTTLHTATIGTTAFSWTPWTMKDAQLPRPYGKPLRGIYRETWVYAMPMWLPVDD